MDLKLESREGFLLATAAGRISLNDALELCKNVCDVATERGFRKVLFDCFAVEGELSVTERFILGKTIVEYCIVRSMAPKVAIIGNPPTITRIGCSGGLESRDVDRSVFRTASGDGLVKQRIRFKGYGDVSVCVPTLESKLPLAVQFRSGRT